MKRLINVNPRDVVPPRKRTERAVGTACRTLKASAANWTSAINAKEEKRNVAEG